MACVKLRKDEDVESLIKRFKKAVKNEGLMDELKRREFYMAPSMKRKEKSKRAAIRRKQFESKFTQHTDERIDY